MDLQLEGKHVLVTGSSSGIGEGIAHRLAQEGARVAVHGRDATRVEAVAAAIRAKGGEAVTVLGDLADDAASQQVAQRALQALDGRVDVLVANAGGRARKGDFPWDETTPQDFASTFQINVFSSVRLVQELVPGMKERGWGRVVLISSVAGQQPRHNLPDYATSKAAITNLAVGMAKWLAGSGITVNAISPGAILSSGIRGFITDMAQRRGWPGDWEALEKRAVDEVFHIPVGRIGRPEDIAAAVALLVSPLGGFFNGANLHIDGGAVGTVH